MDIDDLRRAPTPDGVECGACGEPAVTAIDYSTWWPERVEIIGFCDEHAPSDQSELDDVTDAIRAGEDPYLIIE